MRKIFISGLFASFLIGIAFFFLRYLIIDILDPLFSPLISLITPNEFLRLPLDVVFGVIAIFIIGNITTRIRFQDIYNRYFRKVPRNIERGRGALVSISPGAYYLALITKEVTLKKANGETAQYYAMYAPSTPIPMTGLPVIYVEKSKVIPLNLSYGEFYSVFASFGANSPASLTESKTEITFPEETKADKTPYYD